jgi:hypothetical protein
VVHLSLALNLALTGRGPVGLRAINLVIHLLASLLVGWIVAELARGEPSDARQRASPRMVGLVAALLFAAHPLATQAVTYLIQRTTSLAALLELAAVAFFLRARRGREVRWWAASWSCALLAAQTKEMAVALPIGIALVEATLRAQGRAPARAACSFPTFWCGRWSLGPLSFRPSSSDAP